MVSGTGRRCGEWPRAFLLDFCLVYTLNISCTATSLIQPAYKLHMVAETNATAVSTRMCASRVCPLPVPPEDVVYEGGESAAGEHR